MLIVFDIISVLLALAGLASLIRAIIDREDRVAFILGAMMGFAGAAAVFAVTCIPSAKDHARVGRLYDSVTNNYDFRVMTEDGKRPSVYTVGLSRSDNLSIYGDYSEQEVQDILRVIGEAQIRRLNKKTINVKFYEDELNDSTLYKEVSIKK